MQPAAIVALRIIWIYFSHFIRVASRNCPRVLSLGLLVETCIGRTQFACLCKRQVCQGRTMTGFTAHPDFRPASSVAFAFWGVVLLHIGAVALDAATVGVLKMTRPVKRVLGINVLIGS